MRPIILNFHGVGPIARKIDPADYKYWLEKDFFESVLDVVRDHPSVRITVDDGNSSDFETILPALMRRGLRATFFICSGRINQPTFLNRSQIRELLANGMEIGSHGVAHNDWRSLTPDALQHEIEVSRTTLEEVCAKRIEAAACPFGAYDRRVLTRLRQTGYRRVYTSDGGVSNDSHWLQPRTTVPRSATLGQINDIIHCGASWLSHLVNARVLLKRLR